MSTSSVINGVVWKKVQTQLRVRVSRLRGEGVGALPKWCRSVAAGWCLERCLSMSSDSQCMGELVRQLEERLGCLDCMAYAVAKDFIKEWKALAGEWQHTGLPLGHIWHAHVANHPKGAALLGLNVDPREHRPHTEIACLAPCAICDQKEPREEEPQARRVTDRMSQPAAVESEPSGGGGVSNRGRQQVT
jgi:hypothetical protein